MVAAVGIHPHRWVLKAACRLVRRVELWEEPLELRLCNWPRRAVSSGLQICIRRIVPPIAVNERIVVTGGLRPIMAEYWVNHGEAFRSSALRRAKRRIVVIRAKIRSALPCPPKPNKALAQLGNAVVAGVN